MNNRLSIRFTYFIGFLLIVALLGTAAYLELYEGINPCPLCILQRIVLIALGVIFFFAMVFKTNRIVQYLLGLLGLMVSLGGVLLAGRQVWLQHIPQDGMGECGVSLQYMFKIFPFYEAIKHIWRGGIECSQHDWEFLRLSLAEWSFLWFVGFFILGLIQLKRLTNTKG
jgi:disulfide bond formation protein DsbB